MSAKASKPDLHALIRVKFDEQVAATLRDTSRPSFVTEDFLLCKDVKLQTRRPNNPAENQNMWKHFQKIKRMVQNRDNHAVRRALAKTGGKVPSGKDIKSQFFPFLLHHLNQASQKDAGQATAQDTGPEAEPCTGDSAPGLAPDAGAGEEGSGGAGEEIESLTVVGGSGGGCRQRRWC